MGSDVFSSSTLRFHLILRNIGLIIALSPLTMYTIIILKPCKLIISKNLNIFIIYLTILSFMKKLTRAKDKDANT